MATSRSIPQDQGVVTNTQTDEQPNIILTPEILAGYFSDPPKIAEQPAVHHAAQQFLAEFAREYRRLQGDTPEAGQPAQVSRREFITQAAAVAVAMPLAAAIPVSVAANTAAPESADSFSANDLEFITQPSRDPAGEIKALETLIRILDEQARINRARLAHLEQQFNTAVRIRSQKGN